MTGQIRSEVGPELATVILSNPGKLNALTVQMWRDLKRCFEDLAGKDELRCIVVRGDGDAFSSGADISEFASCRATYDQVVRYHEDDVLGCLTALFQCPIPVVAAVRGACFGGGLEIAALCDIRIASEEARFGAPVGRLGFPLAFAETQAVFRLVGPSAAAELLLEGRIYDAKAARERGLVTRIAGLDEFETALEACVRNILQSGILAARWHKAQIRRLLVDASPVTREERMAVYAFAETDEYHHGIRAFLGRSAKTAGPR